MALLGVKGPSACNEDFGMICHLFFHRLEYLKKDMLFPTDENSLITHFKWGGIMFWNRSLSPLTAYLISFVYNDAKLIWNSPKNALSLHICFIYFPYFHTHFPCLYVYIDIYVVT